MKKLRIALLSGGISSEREVSIKSGNQVYEALDKEKYHIRRYDPKSDLKQLVTDAAEIDAALIILHGPYGEDGTIQGLLELLDIPYQGAGVLGSALAMNKLAAKQLYEKAGLPVPPYRVIRKGEDINPEEFKNVPNYPLVVKPVSGGSSIGMSIVPSPDKMKEAVANAFRYDHTVLAEAYIKGTELTGGVIGNEETHALPIIEIIPGEGYDFFDYEAKYKPGATKEICPARISETLTETAQDYAVTAHHALFCRGYSRTDFILENGNMYVLETNTIPGMTQTSLLPQAAKAAGIGFSQLLDRLINLSLEEHQKRRG